MLAIGERVTFRHPLVRSAVYRSAAAQERRAAHLALAEATDRDVDPDRRAWHLAAAAAGPDEDVALELERSAGRAQARGGLAAAAAFLQRAVALTDDPARRAERALAAAQASLQAGAFDVARGLLAAAEVGPLDELQRARVDLLRAEAAYSQSRGSDAPALLLARREDARAARPAARARDVSRRLERGAVRRASWRAARACTRFPARRWRAPRPAGPPRPADLLLDGFALALTDGRAAAAPVLERAASGFAGNEVSVEEVLRWGWLATAAAVMVWDYETCLAVATRDVQLAREAGCAHRAGGRRQRAGASGRAGRGFRQGGVAGRRGRRVTEATGTQSRPTVRWCSPAFRAARPTRRR